MMMKWVFCYNCRLFPLLLIPISELLRYKLINCQKNFKPWEKNVIWLIMSPHNNV